MISIWAIALILAGLCTGAVLLKAIEALRWRDWRRCCLFALAAVPMVLMAGISGWEFLRDPMLPKNSNFGFGPEWRCTSMGKGEPVCIKAPAGQPSAHE
jgi:MFS family permease